ncbi:MAG: NAD(P)-binding domain-containing protein [Veillonella sp.]
MRLCTVYILNILLNIYWRLSSMAGKILGTTVYYDADCNLSKLEGKKITVLGYGSQGHAHALNLKENGMDVTIGLRGGSSSWKAAEEAGLTVKETAEAVKGADIVMVLIPDELQADVYAQDIAPNLKKVHTWHLLTASTFTLVKSYLVKTSTYSW